MSQQARQPASEMIPFAASAVPAFAIAFVMAAPNAVPAMRPEMNLVSTADTIVEMTDAVTESALLSHSWLLTPRNLLFLERVPTWTV